MGGRGPIAGPPKFSGIFIVSDLFDASNQRFQVVSGTQTALAAGDAQALIITDPGFYDVWAWVGNTNAHAAIARWSLRIQDESNTVVWLQSWVLGTAAADNARFLPLRLFLGLNYRVVLTTGDALGVGESVFTAVQLIQRLQE